MSETATLVVEIHIPLSPESSGSEGEDPFPWIDDVSTFAHDAEEAGEAFIVDDGDEFEGAYVIVITGAEEAALLGIASRIASLPGVPTGVFAMVTDDEAEDLGEGRRVDIS